MVIVDENNLFFFVKEIEFLFYLYDMDLFVCFSFFFRVKSGSWNMIKIIFNIKVVVCFYYVDKNGKWCIMYVYLFLGNEKENLFSEIFKVNLM